MQKKHLGKGLGALIPKKTPEAVITMVSIDDIKESDLQPRMEMDEGKLRELSESVKQRGFLQPIIVRKREDHFEIVAGHRRFEVARRIGLTEVPSIVKDFNDKETLEASYQPLDGRCEKFSKLLDGRYQGFGEKGTGLLPGHRQIFREPGDDL